MLKPFTFMSYIGIIVWWLENSFYASISLFFGIFFFWIIEYYLTRQSLKSIQKMMKVDE
jgi:hypothetical protein